MLHALERFEIAWQTTLPESSLPWSYYSGEIALKKQELFSKFQLLIKINIFTFRMVFFQRTVLELKIP